MVFKKRARQEGTYVWYKVSATDTVFKPVGGKLVMNLEGKLIKPPIFQCPRLPKLSLLKSIAGEPRLEIPNCRLPSHRPADKHWQRMVHTVTRLEVTIP